MKPGIVSTSLTTTRPSLEDEEVDPGQPLDVERLEGAYGEVAHLLDDVLGLARRGSGKLCSRYFASKS